MKRILWLLALASLISAPLSLSVFAQTLPNVSYNAVLNSTCASATAFCSGTANPLGTGVSGLTGPALDVNSQNYAVATVTVAGTYAGATVNFEFSDQTASTNYFQVLCTRTDANIIESNEVLPTNQSRAWQCPIIATTRFRIRISAISSGSINTWITLTQSATDPSPTVVDIISNIAGSTDPCQNPSVLKSSVPVNVTTATTTQLVALSAGKTVYVCGGVIASVGGTSTLEYGTGASCGTGTTVLTGPFPAATTLTLGSGMSLMSTASANALCILSGTSTTATAGFITYVQQ